MIAALAIGFGVLALVFWAEAHGRAHERRTILDKMLQLEREVNSYRKKDAMKMLAVVLMVGLLAGCAPFNPASMSPEQLAAFAKIKDATVTCIIANTPYGKGSGLYINLDKGVLTSGTVTIDDACKTTISNSAAPKP